MRSNVIILTSGLTGSSVLAGLLSRAGYWTGDSTHKKKDYDTYENQELIELNLRIFQEAEYHGDYLVQFSPEAIARIESLRDRSSDDAYRGFIEKCKSHSPWLWKDPRLWMTIHFWKSVVNLQDCKFIVLERNYRQMWISTTLRRQIVTYRRSRQYEQHVKDSAIRFLNDHHLNYLRVRYEDLIVHPSETVAALNSYLDTNLTIEDLKHVYHKPLYKTPASSLRDFVKALLIYVKNYSERLDVATEKS
jgi:hypothetical protein